MHLVVGKLLLAVLVGEWLVVVGQILQEKTVKFLIVVADHEVMRPPLDRGLTVEGWYTVCEWFLVLWPASHVSVNVEKFEWRFFDVFDRNKLSTSGNPFAERIGRLIVLETPFQGKLANVLEHPTADFGHTVDLSTCDDSDLDVSEVLANHRVSAGNIAQQFHLITPVGPK